MKKSILLLWMAFFVVSPNILQAQTTTSLTDVTIYRLLRGNRDFSIVHQLLKYNPDIIDLLDDPSAELTVFFPSNDAINSLVRGKMLTAPTVWRDWLLQLIVPMKIDYDVLLDYPLTYIMTLLDERGLLVQYIDHQVYINTSRVDNSYILENGIAYLLGGEPPTVPPPLSQDSLDLPVELRKTFSFISLHQDLQFFSYLLITDGEFYQRFHRDEKMTFFAPNNDAIQAYLDANDITLGDLRRDDEQRSAFLQRHIITGNIGYDTIQAAVTLLDEQDFRVLALNHNPLTFVDGKDGLTVNGVPFISYDHRMLNGTIHIIDGVIE